MGDHLGSIHFVFFQWQKIRQICQILLISLNYEKAQLIGFFCDDAWRIIQIRLLKSEDCELNCHL